MNENVELTKHVLNWLADIFIKAGIKHKKFDHSKFRHGAYRLTPSLNIPYMQVRYRTNNFFAVGMDHDKCAIWLRLMKYSWQLETYTVSYDVMQTFYVELADPDLTATLIQIIKQRRQLYTKAAIKDRP